MEAPKTKRKKPVSPQAATLLETLKRWCGGPDRAKTDKELSRMAGVSQRDIHEYAKELNYAGHPVIASVAPPFGRYFSRCPKLVRRYGRQLLRRGLQIVRRARVVIRIADAIEAEQQVESSGQMRMFV